MNGTPPQVLFARPAPRHHLEELARRALPLEACGVLLGHLRADAAVVEHVWPAANVHPAPHRAFELDPGAVVAAERWARTRGFALLGFFHSHPGGAPVPSMADRRSAWAGHVHLVAAVAAGGEVILSRFPEGASLRGWERAARSASDVLPMGG